MGWLSSQDRTSQCMCSQALSLSPTTDCTPHPGQPTGVPSKFHPDTGPISSIFLPSSPLCTLHASPSLLWSPFPPSHTEHGSLAAGVLQRYSFNYVKLHRSLLLPMQWCTMEPCEGRSKPRFLPSPLPYHHHHTATKRICICTHSQVIPILLTRHHTVE